MLKCIQIVAISSDYLDGQLRFSARLSVRAHLAMCVNCRRFIRQMRLTQRVLQQLPEPVVADLDLLATHLAEQQQQH
jgi:predicted anti-sigma-YlaC factor YlaD